MKDRKRQMEICVISDVHLGTSGCHARELLNYLRSIKPKILILNGDIIDMWQFKKRFWPKSHMKVLKYIIGLASKGKYIYYVTGNHDETLRKFAGLRMGNLTIVNQIKLELNGKRAWFFHGDVFDVIMQYSAWLAKLGSIGYDLLIRLNILANFLSRLMGRGKVSISKKIKDNVKKAIKYIHDFEETAAHLAIKKGFDFIVCGHMHQPAIRTIFDDRNKSILYLNSGDWVENLTALEYNKGKWRIYSYQKDKKIHQDHIVNEQEASKTDDLDNKELFNRLLNELQN